MKAEMQVYFKSGQKFSYDIEADTDAELASKAREHEYQIATTGYRHNGPAEHTWYMPHWIDKIKVVGINPSSQYNDRPSGT